MSPRKRAFMKVLGAGSRDAPDKNQKHGFCFFILEVNGYAEVIPGDPIRAITCRVEMWRGGLGAAYLLPALSSAGASLASPCFRSTSRSSNWMCGFPASGSRRRLPQSLQPLHVTPSASSENSLGVIRLIANLPFYRRFLRPPSTEAPSLHRCYPASSVLRASPPSHTAWPVSRELPVDP